jgi:hypothetical protein
MVDTASAGLAIQTTGAAEREEAEYGRLELFRHRFPATGETSPS